MYGKAYLASEDSALLRSSLIGYSGKRALEIGAGNCGNLIEVAKRFEIAVGTDVLKPAMEDWRASGASFVLADTGSCIRSCSFDLVFFNPPYLPVEELDDRAVEGGRALQIPLAFLRDALRIVKRDGRVVMLLNGEADIGRFQQVCSEYGFVMKKMAWRHLFYEELQVYEATQRPSTG